MLQRLRVRIKTMEAVKTMEDVDTTVTNTIIAVEEDKVYSTTVIGAEAVMVEATLILHITVGHMECVPIRAKTAGTRKMDTRRTWCSATRFQNVIETAPDRSGQYLLVKLIQKKLKHIIHMNYYVALL